jgi:hypothetical protein
MSTNPGAFSDNELIMVALTLLLTEVGMKSRDEEFKQACLGVSTMLHLRTEAMVTAREPICTCPRASLVALGKGVSEEPCPVHP